VRKRRDGHRFTRREIQQQDVPALNRPLDAGDERDAAIPGAVAEALVFELCVVQGDGERTVPKLGCAIDEIRGTVAD
jgi:hypothetical protein